MTFRYEEAVQERVEAALLDGASFFKGEEKLRSVEFLRGLIEEYGPPIDSYPDWHPLRISQGTGKELPHEQQHVFDHPLYFRDAILIAPYEDCWDILQDWCSKNNFDALRVEKGGLYHHPKTHLYIVRSFRFTCDRGEKYLARNLAIEAILDTWKKPFEYGTPRYATDFTCWESWETMHKMLLGTPCGKRSSLFVDEQTGQAIRRLYACIGQSLGLKEYSRI